MMTYKIDKADGLVQEIAFHVAKQNAEDRERAVRDTLICLGWTPPNEEFEGYKQRLASYKAIGVQAIGNLAKARDALAKIEGVDVYAYSVWEEAMYKEDEEEKSKENVELWVRWEDIGEILREHQE